MPAPIEFAPYRLFVPAAESVLFFARQGNRTLRCYATRAALVTYFDAQPGDEDASSDELLAAYDRAASTLQAIARRMIDAGRASPDGAVVVTSDRVFRSLVGMN